MENTNEKMQKMGKEDKRKENINPGKRIPWYISYTILLILFIISFWLIYKALNINNTKETISIIKNKPLAIYIDKEIIGRGETLKVNIETRTEETVLKSSNSECIKVENNNIIGVKPGEACIYAINTKEISNKINVKCIIKPEKIEISKKQLDLEIGTKEEISVKIFPEDLTDLELIYKSEDEKIAKITDGVVEGINEGKTVITVTDSNEEIKASCKVNVVPIEVSNVVLDDTDVNLGLGQSYILRETVSPSNATYKNITWSSSNDNVITIRNGNIKAVGIGNAIVSATAKNGKKAVCNFNVTNDNPNNKVKYVKESFNVRTGPGTNYTKLDSVSTNDEIEILKETNNWAKIRVQKNGIVGYTLLKSYSSEKTYYINNVPFLNQYSLGYPTGCEAVAAAMAAKFSGYNISVQKIIDNTPTDSLGIRQETKTKETEKEILNEETGAIDIVKEIEEEKIWVGENPFKFFVGYPTKRQSEGSYGCFASPISIALQNSGVPCTNISGSSIDTVYSYIRMGKPVIVWGRKNGLDLNEGITWTYPDGSGNFVELIGEHCFVLIGYDGDYVYLNDPAAGAGVKQAKWKFESNWHKLYNQAVIIN